MRAGWGRLLEWTSGTRTLVTSGTPARQRVTRRTTKRRSKPSLGRREEEAESLVTWISGMHRYKGFLAPRTPPPAAGTVISSKFKSFCKQSLVKSSKVA